MKHWKQPSIREISVGRKVKQWKQPSIKEISVGMEINCYACAEL